MVPVHIVSGFLGAGKTTAILAQLEARAGERIAVIVNDFGEASLDEARLSEAAPFRITSIAGACVCCTAPEGFVSALGAVLEARPDRLLIEPTGLARPQDLIDSIRRCPDRDRLALAPVVVLLDPARLEALGDAERRLRDEQVEAADVLVANRIDLCGDAELARFDAWVRELWPPPLAVHRTSHGRVPLSLMEWPDAETPRTSRADARGRTAHRHASTEGFTARSWSWPPDVVFARERLLEALERLRDGGRLVRFKGVFRTREGVVRVELAGGRVDERASAHRRDSRADAIFAARDAGAADDAGCWLAEAVLTEEERRARTREVEVVRADGRITWFDRDLLLGLPDDVPDVSRLVPARSGRAARIARLFEQLAIPARGEAVVCAADGFVSQPVAATLLCQGLLLHSLGDEALPEKQGGPFRLLIPEEVEGAPPGCANVKAVTRIVLRDSAS